MDLDLLELMPYSVTIKKFSAWDAHGNKTFLGAISCRAAVQEKQQKVISLQGIEQVSTMTVIMNTVAAIDSNDNIVLPSGYVPQERSILAFARRSDEMGLSHTVAYV